MQALFLSHDSPSSRAQIEPFYLYRNELADRLDFRFTNLMLRDGVDPDVIDRFDVVFVQPKWFRNAEDVLHSLLRATNAQKVILDDNDSAGRSVYQTAPFVDLYVKKQVLRNFDDYRRSHESQRIHAQYVDVTDGVAEWRTFDVPDCFRDKLYTGWNIGTERSLHDRLHRPRHPASASAGRPIDVSMRVSVDLQRPGHWYCRHRQRALEAVSALSDSFQVVSSNTIASHDAYHKELESSKICLSPWGYGEVCFRDFEAIMAGALLVKPSMEHLTTEPNIYVAGETYVPVRSDFSDLREVCRHYLAHEELRAGIVKRALAVYQDYFDSKAFLRQMTDILARLRLARNS